MSRLRRPARRQSTRPATPWGGRSSAARPATRTSVPTRSSRRKLGVVKRKSTGSTRSIRCVAAAELVGDARQDSIDERAAVFRAVALRELHRFVQENRSRLIVLLQELPRGDPQHVSIYAVHPFQSPVL